jgi:hypothetical protein
MINSAKLREIIKKKGLKYGFIANELGITCYSLKKKIDNETDFKMSEVQELCNILKVNNKLLKEIFLYNQ